MEDRREKVKFELKKLAGRPNRHKYILTYHVKVTLEGAGCFRAVLNL
jgi:hypothetical protein